jgi:hypothetical protein
MFTKSHLLGTLGGFVVLFLGGWLFYDILAADFYAAHTSEAAKALLRGDNTNLLLVALGSLVQACVMASLYGQLADKGNGLKFGAFFGLFVGFGMGLLSYGLMDYMDMTGALVDFVWSIVFYAIIGWVIAFVSNKFAS